MMCGDRDGKVSRTTHTFKVTGTKRMSVDETIATPFYKKASVKDRYNGIVLRTNRAFSVEFRVYDDGAAYRFSGTSAKPYTVSSETAEFRFAGDYRMFVPYESGNANSEPYCSASESYYDEVYFSEMNAQKLTYNPLVVCLPDGKRAALMDLGVEDYPLMFLQKGDGNSLKGVFAPYPLETYPYERNILPSRRAGYIARVGGARTFPWRVVAVVDNDCALLNNDMCQRLSPACRIADTSWIKPGKVAWDWWNDTNLTGVDFRAGMNTDTYRYFIDFAQANRLEYIIIDEGWSGKNSLYEMNPEIDLPQLISYANERGVGIILWTTWRNIVNGTEQVCAHYANMGIRGFKVDFFDRDDQVVIKSIQDIAECAAKHHLVLDLHGMRSFGTQRAYPNILSCEGVKGMENLKWQATVDGKPENDFPRHDVTIPFLRTLAGPVDYTPGAMLNARQCDFKGNYSTPMSQGTRVHQLAMYIAYESPLQMLSDSPTNYEREQECTDFIAQIPTTFDETIALDGQIGKYLVVARRKGNTWYIGAMNNWDALDLTIDLSSLALPSAASASQPSLTAIIFSDGINADRNANDYKKTVRQVTSGDKLNIHLAPGGGWAAIIR